jgi:hypothetical protein
MGERAIIRSFPPEPEAAKKARQGGFPLPESLRVLLLSGGAVWKLRGSAAESKVLPSPPAAE